MPIASKTASKVRTLRVTIVLVVEAPKLVTGPSLGIDGDGIAPYQRSHNDFVTPGSSA